MAPAPDADGAASVVTEERAAARRGGPRRRSRRPRRPHPSASRPRRRRRPAARALLLAGADTGAGALGRFSLAERAPPASPTGAELAAMFPAEGDTVEIIWQKDTTLEVDGAGDRCIVASLRGPFPDKKKKRRSSTSAPGVPRLRRAAVSRAPRRRPGAPRRAAWTETDRRPAARPPQVQAVPLHARGRCGGASTSTARGRMMPHRC